MLTIERVSEIDRDRETLMESDRKMMRMIMGGEARKGRGEARDGDMEVEGLTLRKTKRMLVSERGQERERLRLRERLREIEGLSQRG